ncbi:MULTISPECIES: hypothetical protein [Nocardia]|uniref:Uncharacterized protein n=1 Tax=Nocardia africana TaxID=134964 RepID=A0A378X5L8_9NOCA|nr:hypothetical protein [Nocardia africana]MCC3317943.1 hypothetical protein [Nocardia africana]SUA48718.1 Uncharacterised protein [Nocardia africana]
MKKTILLQWDEYTRHSAVLKVPHDFDLSADNDHLYRTAVPEISDDSTTYDAGEYLSFTAREIGYRANAEPMFFEPNSPTALTPPSAGSAEPPIVMLPNSALGAAMARTSADVSLVLPDGPSCVGIEVAIDSAAGITDFMTALAEVSGFSFEDLTRDGYLDNDDPESDPDRADGPPTQFYYFPQILLVDDSDAPNH